MSITILVGDARAVLATLPAESVQCVVTSPPYWGLRSYIADGDPLKPYEIGLEPTPEAYVAHLVEVFRAVRRVLRSDGVMFCNLGDAYQDKQLLGIPWRVAFALQADGWWLRSEIIWAKPNPMPESVTDRPTKAHESLFLLAKAERYYYDAEAIKDSGTGRARGNTGPDKGAGHGDPYFRTREGFAAVADTEWFSRNKRSVWTIPSAPFAEAHFATFPPALVEPCVQAGTSARGACPACGAPWRREFETDPAYRDWAKTQRFYGPGGLGSAFRLAKTNSQVPPKGHTTGWAPTCACVPGLAPGVVEPCVKAGTSERGCCAQCGAPWRREVERAGYTALDLTPKGAARGAMGLQSAQTGLHERGWQQQPMPTTTTLGWAPTCTCAPQPVPCVVLDPFAGAGTVGLVAERLGRDAILIELKPEYAAMAERRIREEAPLLTAVEVEGETVDVQPSEPGDKARTTPRGAHEGARWNQNQGRGLPRADGQPWARAAPAASENGHGPAAPEQLALDWAEIARVDV
jgi:DNA modification methylase